MGERPRSTGYERLEHSDRRLFDRSHRALERLRSEPQAGKPLVGQLKGLAKGSASVLLIRSVQSSIRSRHE